MIEAQEWKPGVPSTPGYFDRRIRWLFIRLAPIRVVRWKGHLVWNLASDTRNFQYIYEFKLRNRWFCEYKRINGVHLL